jgi:hypothetical protein
MYCHIAWSSSACWHSSDVLLVEWALVLGAHVTCMRSVLPVLLCELDATYNSFPLCCNHTQAADYVADPLILVVLHGVFASSCVLVFSWCSWHLTLLAVTHTRGSALVDRTALCDHLPPVLCLVHLTYTCTTQGPEQNA